MQIILLIISGTIIICAAVALAIYGVRWYSNRDDVTSRLTEMVEEPIRGTKSTRRQFLPAPREFTDSLSSRIFMPIFRGLARAFSRVTPSGAIEEYDRQLTIAANPFNLRGREFFGVKWASFFLGIWIAVIFVMRGLDRLNVVMAILSVIVFYLLPDVWLKGRVRTRQDRIRRGLPDAFDMLTVCASAGLGFDQAMKRVSEYWETPVGVEFGRVINEMEMGLSREEALHNLSYRLGMSEISSFVSFVLQTGQLGLSITDTLHTQAEQMRIERRLRAQEQAQKIPTKMLFPMVFLIFPALLAMIIGPAVPEFIRAFSNMGLK